MQSNAKPQMSAKQAARLLKADMRNIKKKVDKGSPLTLAQRSLLESVAGHAGGAVEEPKFVKNKTELADVFGISRKTIQRYSLREDFPAARSDGRWCVAEVRTYLDAQDVLPEDSPHKSELQAKQLLLQNQLLEHKLAVAREEFVASVDVEKEVGELILTAKQVLLSGPASLAPQVVGVSIQEAETIIKEWLHNALKQLQRDPLGRKTSEPPAASVEIIHPTPEAAHV